MPASAQDGQGFRSACSDLLRRIEHWFGGGTPETAAQKKFLGELDAVAKQVSKKGALRTPEYMDRVLEEWMALGRPDHDLRVLSYPVPVLALEVLDLASRHRMPPEFLLARAEEANTPPLLARYLEWAAALLKSPRYQTGTELRDWIGAYRRTRKIQKTEVLYWTGIPVLPEPGEGRVRLYKGSYFRGPAISQSMVGKPPEEIPSGAHEFMTYTEAVEHSERVEAFHPNGISVSTDKTVILQFGSYVKVYDVPLEVFRNLPRGDRALGEYVFKYSIPEEYRVITVPKETWAEVIKLEHKAVGSLVEGVRSGVVFRDPRRLIGLLKNEEDPVLVHGRKLDLAEVFRSTLGTRGAGTIEEHVLFGYAQMDRLMPHFDWSRIPDPPNVDLRRTIQFAFALHDSGKPLAFELKLPGMHEEFSARILAEVMARAGFAKAEIDLACALIGNDAIGLMIQGKLSPQEAYEQIVAFSRRTVLSPREFFEVQSFYYAVDAGAYPELVQVFRTEDKMLIPDGDKYRVLVNLFDHAD